MPETVSSEPNNPNTNRIFKQDAHLSVLFFVWLSENEKSTATSAAVPFSNLINITYLEKLISPRSMLSGRFP